MLLTIKIRLKSPLLGQQATGKSPGAKGTSVQVRRFKKEGDQISIDIPQWLWWFREAANALKMKDVDVSCIRMDSGFRAPALFLHNRRWTQSSKLQQECFESIREGTVLTLPLFIASTEDPKSPLRPPTLTEVHQLFAFVGQWLGISPWGGKFGYGRFTVDSCNETPTSAPDQDTGEETAAGKG